MPTVHSAPSRPKRGVKRAIGKQTTIGLDGISNHDGWFKSEVPAPEEPHPHPHFDPAPSVTVAGIERPASVPPILKDDDDAMIVEAEGEAGARANRKRKRDQLVWDYRDDKAGDGDENVSDDEVVLTADERKRARIGHVGSARRRSFGDDKRRPGSAVRSFSFLA
jgi:hypothetical protein